MARKIRLARKINGHTQESLARSLGITLRSVAGWEGGTSRPSSENLEALARELGRDPKWFYGVRDEVNLIWRTLYEDGTTIEEIALEYELSPGAIRKGLLAVGVEMRPPGQRPGTTHQNNTRSEANKPARGGAVHAVLGGARAAHRRRGGKRAA